MEKKNFWMTVEPITNYTNFNLSTKNFKNCLVDEKNFVSLFSKIDKYNEQIKKFEESKSKSKSA